MQRQLYEAFLKSEMVHSSISGSPLAALTVMIIFLCEEVLVYNDLLKKSLYLIFSCEFV